MSMANTTPDAGAKKVRRDIHGSGVTVEESDVDIYGDHCIITGSGCTVIGSYNRIFGERCTVIGSHNTIYAKPLAVDGEDNRVVERAASFKPKLVQAEQQLGEDGDVVAHISSRFIHTRPTARRGSSSGCHLPASSGTKRRAEAAGLDMPSRARRW